MTIKLKEFKGVLAPIFNEDIKKDIIEEYTFNHTPHQELLIPVDKIIPRKDQPRKIFDEVSLEELTISIKSKGVIQPIIVSVLDEDSYEIIVGERRWRAAKKAGLEKIPAIIRSYSKADIMAVALIENIQRKNLNPLEEAYAIQKLLEEFSMTHSQIAESIGRSRVAVTHFLRILNLETEVKKIINLGLLEMGHAKVLLSLEGQHQIDAANYMVDKSLSVRAAEKLVQNYNSKKEKQEVVISEAFSKKIENWKTTFSKNLYTKINLHIDAGGKGRFVIQFDSMEEAEWIMDNLELKKK